jgi:hypothetical protein
VNNFQWNGNLNLSFTKNKVIKMPEQIPKIFSGARTGTNITEVGEPVGSLYGFIALGLFNKENIDNPNLHKYVTKDRVLGAPIFKDINGDGVVNLEDKTVIGNPHPKITFGFSNQFSYKNISLSVLLSGMLGYQILRRYLDVLTNVQGRYNVSTLELHRWKSPSDPGAGFLASVPQQARLWKSSWLSPGGHMWVQNVTLGYDLPQHVLQPAGIKKLNLYVSINNLALLTNYAGFNPEVGSSESPLTAGIDTFIYPLSRLYTFGVNITF